MEIPTPHPCKIILQLRPGDRGVTLTQRLSQFPLPLEGSTPAPSVTVSKAYLAIRVTQEGDLDGVGRTLRRSFKRYAAVRSLVLGGNIDRLSSFSTRYYHRADGKDISPWRYCRPQEYGGRAEFEPATCPTYLFTADGWQYADADTRWFTPLAAAIDAWDADRG